MKTTCMVCGYTARPPLEQPAGSASMPSKGDFWLCSRCAALHRFTGGYLIDARTYAISSMIVRLAELGELEQLEPHLARQLLTKRAEILATVGIPSA